MPASIDASIKRRVIQQWLSGCPRDKIALDNNIGEGTVSSIVSEFKIGLDSVEFGSARELALTASKQGLTTVDLASHFRLYNYFRVRGPAKMKSNHLLSTLAIVGIDTMYFLII